MSAVESDTLLTMWAQRGHQVIGIEQSLKAREYVQTEWGLTCFSSFLGENAQAFLKPESVDAITLWHVLEHIDTILAFQSVSQASQATRSYL